MKQADRKLSKVGGVKEPKALSKGKAMRQERWHRKQDNCSGSRAAGQGDQLKGSGSE